MYKTLFKHYWLKSFRSPGYYKNLVVNIFMGLTVLYFVVIFMIMGFMLPGLLKEIAPHQDPAATFNGIMIYTVIALLMTRYEKKVCPLYGIQEEGINPGFRDDFK